MQQERIGAFTIIDMPFVMYTYFITRLREVMASDVKT